MFFFLGELVFVPFSLFQPMKFAELCFFVRSSGRVPQLAVLKHFPPVDAAVAAFFGAELLGTVGHGVPPCHGHGLAMAGQHHQQWLKEKVPGGRGCVISHRLRGLFHHDMGIKLISQK